MSANRIVVTPRDYPALRNLAEALPRRSHHRQEHYERFIREIRNAHVTESPEATNGVITLRSRVTYRYDGSNDIADAISVLGFLFSGQAPPPPPAGTCGPDPTPDPLDCLLPTSCP